MSSFDHLLQYSIGLLCLVVSSVLYFFYFNSINSTIERPFFVAYQQSTLNLVIFAILICLFENSRFKLVKNKTSRLLYSPLNQFEDMQIFEMTRPLGGKNGLERSFLTESTYEDLRDDEATSEEEEQFKKVQNNPDYIVKINEEYNQQSDDVNNAANKQKSKPRKVKFNKKKEVRHLKGIYARSAILSSYENFLQLNYQLLNHYSNLAFSNSISIVPIYSLVYFLSIFFFLLSIEPVGFFDLNPGYSLLFIVAIQYFYFSPSLTERITLTKSTLCVLSLASLYLIRCSSTKPLIDTTPPSVNQTVLNDSTDLFVVRCKSLFYALLSSFFSSLFVCSLRNKYEQEDFDIKVFSSFLSLFTAVVVGAVLLFVLNRRLTEPILPLKSELISIFQPFSQFFLIIGCLYTNTMVALLCLSFTLPISYSLNFYSDHQQLNNRLFLVGTFLLVVCFLCCIYVTFYEFAKSKRKDFLAELFENRFKFYGRKQIRKFESQRVFLDEDF